MKIKGLTAEEKHKAYAWALEVLESRDKKTHWYLPFMCCILDQWLINNRPQLVTFDLSNFPELAEQKPIDKGKMYANEPWFDADDIQSRIDCINQAIKNI